MEWIWEGRDARDDVGRRMLLLIRERVAAGDRGAENDDERGLQTGRESSIGSLLLMVKKVQEETAVVPTTSVLLSRSTGGIGLRMRKQRLVQCRRNEGKKGWKRQGNCLRTISKKGA